MSSKGVVFLMYHELQFPARPLCQVEEGYSRYVVAEADFRSQMQCLRQTGWRGLSVTEALLSSAQNSNDQKVAITFDDGCESDFTGAVPILQDAGFNATFFVTIKFLGVRGYMQTSQLRELSALGFELGCHSMTHAYLTDLDDHGLQREIGNAKVILEDIIGKPVEHFSCPGGRCDRRVIEFARRCGYRSVANSRVRVNTPTTDPFDLGRVTIRREVGLATFQKICQGKNLRTMRLLNDLRAAAKQVMGNSLYDRGRALLLR
jgi:peptidoglycan/xylan/chitin deacetylase (PgdA/CDA1 family)